MTKPIPITARTPSSSSPSEEVQALLIPEHTLPLPSNRKSRLRSMSKAVHFLSKPHKFGQENYNLTELSSLDSESTSSTSSDSTSSGSRTSNSNFSSSSSTSPPLLVNQTQKPTIPLTYAGPPITRVKARDAMCGPTVTFHQLDKTHVLHVLSPNTINAHLRSYSHSQSQSSTHFQHFKSALRRLVR